MIMLKNPVGTETVQSKNPSDPNSETSTKVSAPSRRRKKVPRPRIRLTPKQAQFIYRIFSRGYTVEAAMDELQIWPRKLDEWLRQDRFNQAIEFKLSQFHLQTRINAALFAPRAVRTLGYMFDTQAEYETKRKASVDLLKFLDSLKSQKEGAGVACGGAQVAQSGSPLAQTGTRGLSAARENTTNTIPNPRFRLENKENARFQIFSTKEADRVDDLQGGGDSV